MLFFTTATFFTMAVNAFLVSSSLRYGWNFWMQSFVVASFFSLKNAMTIDSSSGRFAFFLGFPPSAAAAPAGVGGSSGALRLRVCVGAGGLLARPPATAGVPDRLPPTAAAPTFDRGTGLDARLPPARGLPARLVPAAAAPMTFCLGALGLVARFATTALPRPGELAREGDAWGCARGLGLGFWGRGVWAPEPRRAGVGVVVPLGGWICDWLRTAGSLRGVWGLELSSGSSSSCCRFVKP
jgi:hypothetical protein